MDISGNYAVGIKRMYSPYFYSIAYINTSSVGTFTYPMVNYYDPNTNNFNMVQSVAFKSLYQYYMAGSFI